jgi:hypothetical protein
MRVSGLDMEPVTSLREARTPLIFEQPPAKTIQTAAAPRRAVRSALGIAGSIAAVAAGLSADLSACRLLPLKM